MLCRLLRAHSTGGDECPNYCFSLFIHRIEIEVKDVILNANVHDIYKAVELVLDYPNLCNFQVTSIQMRLPL
jgi:hypothetical protein